MGRFLLFLSYVGTKYSGIQIQKVGNLQRQDIKTVAGVLEKCLNNLEIRDKVKVRTSSRTDQGVHALINTVHIDILYKYGQEFEASNITSYLNKRLSRAGEYIRILKTVRVCDDFHSRYNAIGRSYLYRLAIPRSEDGGDDPKTLWCPMESDRLYFVKRPFNVEAFLKTAEILSGVHDFSAITVESQRRDGITHPYRNVTIGIRRGDMILQKEYSLKPNYDVWEMHFKSKSYLYKQIRRMIGCMVAVGRGKFQVQDIQKFLQDPKHLEDHKIESAPSCGLYLKDVHYKASDLVYWPNRDVDYELFLDEAYQNYSNDSGNQSIKSLKENHAFGDNDTEENKNTELSKCERASDLLKEETDQSCFSSLNSLTIDHLSETSCIDESETNLKHESETSLKCESETSLKCKSETSLKCESETSLKCEKETNFECESEIEEGKNVRITSGSS
ncbi:hypothetical protein SNE40_013882 [Patella caerulea]|uniref:tRNA pseudouridine synthase n=1 Tax=Patella caerulea TaxID=87958 RepID=A0AAN8JJ37_PATCE